MQWLLSVIRALERPRWANCLSSGVRDSETPVSAKIQKIRWVWWQLLVVPATREAEAGELLEPGRQRLQ